MVEVQAWTLIPFAIMLLTIAVAPLVAEHFWESNRNKLIATLIIAVPTAIYLICAGLGHNLMHQMLFDYVPFIILLLALFVVTGGIRISGDIPATPIINSAFLAAGYILASLMGTTGAAMLLIRPLLETNQQRTHKVHTVLFFIAMVANCGGLLTPLGDPPLFLLYLRGASFDWFSSLHLEWMLTGSLLLGIYFIYDRIMYRKEPISALKQDMVQIKPLRLKGAINLLYLVLVVLSVVFLNESYIPAMGAHDAPIYVKFIREYVLVAIILLSVFTTKKNIRQANKFTWAPILEVAILFVGIFTTMTPAMIFLNAHAPELGLGQPWHFYYCTGALSSFLDNAPTAVAFHTVASGMPIPEGATIVAGIPEAILKAIALGSVMFGSMTYIGNGPNFMVKAIAEENGVKMPSFFGYIVKFSLAVLLPVYVLVQLIFI